MLCSPLILVMHLEAVNVNHDSSSGNPGNADLVGIVENPDDFVGGLARVITCAGEDIEIRREDLDRPPYSNPHVQDSAVPLLVKQMEHNHEESLTVPVSYILSFGLRELGEGLENPRGSKNLYTLSEYTMFTGNLIEVKYNGRKVVVKVKSSPAEITLLGGVPSSNHDYVFSLEGVAEIAMQERDVWAGILADYHKRCKELGGNHNIAKLKIFIGVNGREQRAYLNNRGLVDHLQPFFVKPIIPDYKTPAS